MLTIEVTQFLSLRCVGRLARCSWALVELCNLNAVIELSPALRLRQTIWLRRAAHSLELDDILPRLTRVRSARLAWIGYSFSVNALEFIQASSRTLQILDMKTQVLRRAALVLIFNNCTALESFAFRFKKAPATLQKRPTVRTLTYLRITHGIRRPTPVFIEACPNLVSLTTRDGVFDAKTAAGLPQLRELKLVSNEWDFHLHWQVMFQLPSLTALELSGNFALHAPSSPLEFKGLQSLKMRNVSRMHLEMYDAAAWTGVSLPNLQHLSLHGSCEELTVLLPLIARVAPNLKVLSCTEEVLLNSTSWLRLTQALQSNAWLPALEHLQITISNWLSQPHARWLAAVETELKKFRDTVTCGSVTETDTAWHLQ